MPRSARQPSGPHVTRPTAISLDWNEEFGLELSFLSYTRIVEVVLNAELWSQCDLGLCQRLENAVEGGPNLRIRPCQKKPCILAALDRLLLELRRQISWHACQ